MGLEVITRNYVPVLAITGQISTEKSEKVSNSVFEEAKATKKEDVKEENNNEETSLWEKVKNWFKNPSKAIGLVCGGVGLGMLGIALASTLNPVTTSFALLGILMLFMAGCSIVQGYEAEKNKEYDKKANEQLEKMVKKKLEEQDEEKLDTSETKDVEKLYGTQNLVAFKTKNGAIAAKVNVPLSLKLNEILEKYSTKDNPEISPEEQDKLLKETDELFKELKTKAQSSHMATNRAYAFGQYDIASAVKIAESKEAEFKKLIAEYTQEKSSNGKNIDKSELLDLREKMFASLNSNS